MSWWSEIKHKLTGAPAAPPSPDPAAKALPTARWLDAADNRFGIPVLDLTPITQTMPSATQDPAVAARAVGWAKNTGAELEDAALQAAAPIACALRYPAAPVLPDGLLFTPSRMEEKWVIAFRRGAILAARSWTGIVDAVAETRREGDELVVHALRLAEPTALRTFGDPVQTREIAEAEGKPEVVALLDRHARR
jgi:hypothetical protein